MEAHLLIIRGNNCPFLRVNQPDGASSKYCVNLKTDQRDWEGQSQPRAKFSLVLGDFMARISAQLWRKAYICRNG